jgi:hypothetical protein
MSLPVTLILLAIFVGLAAVCRWRGSRPLDIVKGPRIVPWGGLMMACVVAALLMIVHLLNILGMQTGQQPR